MNSNTMNGTAITPTVTYDFKKSLINKAVIVAAIAMLAATVFYIIRHYFYILDAYVYTGEFHLLFITKNMHMTKLELFTEYLKPMSFLMALPVCLTGTCYAGLDPSSSQQVLFQATTDAFGAPMSFLFGFLGFFVLGLLSFGIGSLIFGDIVPLLARNRYGQYLDKLKNPALITFAIAFALPFVPIIIAAVIGAVSKVPSTRMLQCMLAGFMLRTLALMLMQ
ncbi:MAG: hypothetical protein KKC76_07475 [Proteobacteria bacterium]|nr:hypothetical protein [Pseudomonadota bacterium]MBU4297376.1 hypothetical protein [Pseudomonadota bacterium]MCG2749629.1 hypothetical protein [Desulfobulbaceae bacterium]